jgi:hypothetical protein
MRGILPLFVAGLVCCCPAAAGAQTPTQDSVTGVGGALRPDNGFGVGFDISASSGSSGEHPTGNVQFTRGRFPYFGGPVTCLAVNANVAAMNLDTDGSIVTLEVTDLPTGDLMRVAMADRSPSDCSALGTAIDLRVTSGDVTVVDAHPFPTSKDQCKNGGWRTFGVFKNQGNCVNFVRRQARQECIFIRAAVGRPAFRAQFGSGIHKRHAMRRCTRERMND